MTLPVTRRKKRGAGEGSTRLRADGRWEIRFTLPNWSEPERVRENRRRGAQKAPGGAARDRGAGGNLNAGKSTVGEFFADWLRDVVKPGRAPKTHEFYADIFRLYIEPDDWSVRLNKLTPALVATCCGRNRRAGSPPDGPPHPGRPPGRVEPGGEVARGLYNAAALVDSPPRRSAVA